MTHSPISPKNGLVLVGIVGAPRGLKGDVRVKSFTADAQGIGDYGSLTDETGTRNFDVKVIGHHKGQMVVRIKGVNDRTAAEALKAQALYIKRERLPELKEEEYYFSDLRGLQAQLKDGTSFGRVVEVEDYGGGAFLELAVPDRGRVLVPFTKAAVPVVDIAGARVVIDPPEGLLEPGEPEPQSLEEDGS